MGMQPIAGYNYGAGNFDRLSEIYKLTSKVCMLLGLVGSLVGCIFPEYIMRAFTTDSNLIEIGSSAMIYWVIMFPLIGFTVVNSQFFQSIDKPLVAIITSLSRQLIFLLPLCFALPQVLEKMGYDGLTGVWLSGTISDVLGATLAAVLLYSQRHVFYVKE